MKKRLLSLVMAIAMVCSLAVMMPEMRASATQKRSGNFNKNYTLTGNGADDIVAVALAQQGKTGSKLGYSEPWCANFVGDCSDLAGQSAAIPRNGSCTELINLIKSEKYGGRKLSATETPRKGDLIFFKCSKCGYVHVGIMTGAKSDVEGNSSNTVVKKSPITYTDSAGHTYNHKNTTNIVSVEYVRPNYKGVTPPKEILPGTVDNTYNVPVEIKATKKIDTYDVYGTKESDHYIDKNDVCYISEVYTNSFVKIKYPTSSGNRWSYAKASDFSIGKNADIGTDFYAYIKNSKKPIMQGSDTFVVLMSESKADKNSTIWHFIRNSDGTYKIESYKNKKVLDVQKAVDENGSKVLCYESKNNDNQRWYVFKNSDGTYRLKAKFTSKYLDVKGGSTADGAIVQIYSGKENAAKKFSIEKVTLQNVCAHSYGSWSTTKAATCAATGTKTRKCSLCGKSETQTIAKTTNHSYTSKIVDPTFDTQGYTLHTCTVCSKSYKDNYTKSEYSIDDIVNIGTDFYAYIKNSNKPIMQGSDTFVVLMSDSKADKNSTIWHFVRNSDGTYKIESLKNKKVLDVQKAVDENGTKVLCYESKDNDNQRWYIFKNSDGTYKLKAKFTSRFLDVKGASSADGAVVEIYNGNDSAAQKFVIEKITLQNVCSHSYGSWSTTKAATCAETGSKTRKCSLCGKSETQTIAKLTTHSFGDWTTAKSATCAEEGTQTRKCSVCGKTETKSIAKTTNHSYTTRVIAATKTTQGYTLHTCSVCGDNYKDTYTPIVIEDHNHIYTSEVTKSASCAETGIFTYTCDCGANYTETTPKLTTHTFGNWSVTTVATCEAEGIETRKCSVCGKTETRSIAKTAHSYTTKVIAPTTTAQGYTLYTCTVCGDSYKDNYTEKLKITDVSNATVSGISDVIYTGKAIKPTPTVKLSGKTLKSGTDYTVSYKNNTKAGKATVTITGKGNYKGTCIKIFAIKPASIAKAKVTGIEDKSYTGSPITQKPVVKLGSVKLKLNTDYTLSYKKNKAVGTATVTIKGKGNYTGSINKTFKITKTISKEEIIERADYLYGITWTPLKDVYGYGKISSYTFKKGKTYHIPYGMIVSSGTWVGDTRWKNTISVDSFLTYTQDIKSKLYTSNGGWKKSGYKNAWYCPYYAIDCSSFVSYCWNLANRTTTFTSISTTVIGKGKLTDKNIDKIQIGDAIDSPGHITLITDVVRDKDGKVTKVEITEETPPQLKRTVYTRKQFISNNSKSGYTVLRYKNLTK